LTGQDERPTVYRRDTRVRLKKTALTAGKFGVSFALLGYLGYRAWSDYQLHRESFEDLLAGPKDWAFLGLAWLAVLGAVLLTFLRWRLLVRTLDIPLSMLDAMRIGFVGYMFTLAASLVGGDALKAAYLIHLQPKRKTEAIATVVIDRALGLYALLVLAAVASLFLDISALNISDTDRMVITQLCNLSRILAVGITAAIGLLMVPGVTTSKTLDRLEHLPGLGGQLHKLVVAIRIYRRRVDRMLIAFAMSLGMHSLYALMVYWVAIGLRTPHPPLGSHFVIVPVSMVAGTLPIGAFELILDMLYRSVSSVNVLPSQGLVIALIYRLLQISVASVGVVFYLMGRREVKELMHEAEEVAATDIDEPLPSAAGSETAPAR
jgi:uncharacterized protein (TIRG00374 family)